MSYRYDKERSVRKRWYFLGAVLIIVLLFTPIYRFIFDIIERPLAKSWEQQNEVFTGTENFFLALYGKKEILEENQILRDTIARLEIDNQRTQYLAEELESITSFTQKDTSLLPAQVIQHGTFGARDTLVINRGTRDGITPGLTVIHSDMNILGEISEVYDRTARVTLYSQVNSSVSGVLFPHGITINARGYGNGNFLIETPREVEVAAGDILYSLEQPGNIIAIVREVVFDPRDPFKKVYLSYPINLNQIQTVGVKSQKIDELIR